MTFFDEEVSRFDEEHAVLVRKEKVAKLGRQLEHAKLSNQEPPATIKGIFSAMLDRMIEVEAEDLANSQKLLGELIEEENPEGVTYADAIRLWGAFWKSNLSKHHAIQVSDTDD